MTTAVTVNEVLHGQVGLDLECLDRIYLNAYVPSGVSTGGQFTAGGNNGGQASGQQQPISEEEAKKLAAKLAWTSWPPRRSSRR